MKEYIEREAALGFTKPEEWGTPDERWRPESEFGEFIKALPKADVKPVVKGEWVNGMTTCSACGWYMGDDNAGGVYRICFPFCPNCGAKMV